MYNKNLFLFLILSISMNVMCVQNNNHNNNNKQKNKETFEQDLTDTFKIEGSDQGIQRVNLKCGADSMNVILETEKPFNGVMYTRGSFYKQQAPCFVKSQNGNSHALEMKFQLNECQTQHDGDLYSNVVVIQNDPELIMPGDSAFSLECDFRQSRNIDVEANYEAKDRVATGSRITLTSPDPGYNSDTDVQTPMVFNASDNVIYLPKSLSSSGQHEVNPELILGTVEEIQTEHEKDEL